MATIRRLYKQGNSVVLSVPGWMLEQIGAAAGDEVLLEKMADYEGLTVRRWNPPASGTESAETMRRRLGGRDR